MIVDYFKRAMEKLRTQGRPDPETTRKHFEDEAKALLDQYAAEVRGEMEQPRSRTGMWIFRQQIDHEVYVQALCALLDDIRQAGRAEGVAELAKQMDYQCACRCREHRHPACVKCLDVYGCPVHSDADPEVLRPEFLKDPEAVARAIHVAYKGVAAEMGAIVGESWEDSSPEYQRAMVESVHRVVTVRLEARRG